MGKYIVFIVAAVVFTLCCWQAECRLSRFAKKCLAAHNAARKKHGASPMVWDATLAKHAKQWADKLNRGALPIFSIHSKLKEGENIAYLENPTCKEAVKYWMDEFIDYKDMGYCKRPTRYVDSWLMHFTQIVWKKTTKMGAAVSGHYLVVRYTPHGNYPGQFAKNVKC